MDIRDFTVELTRGRDGVWTGTCAEWDKLHVRAERREDAAEKALAKFQRRFRARTVSRFIMAGSGEYHKLIVRCTLM